MVYQYQLKGVIIFGCFSSLPFITESQSQAILSSFGMQVKTITFIVSFLTFLVALYYESWIVWFGQNNFILMRTSSNLNDLMISLAGKTDSKLGFTTTVKEQVDDIQVTIDHFKKSLENQRKQQSELQMQLKKLEESTKTQFQELHKQISERVNYLTELFKSDSNGQNKEFEYLQLQNQTLHDEHDRLNQMTNNVMGRTEQVENNVGI